MSTEERGRSGYLDLLITTLMEYEKSLDGLVERLENVHKGLSATYEEARAKTGNNVVTKEKGKTKSDSDTLVYLKTDKARPLDEIVKIIQSLKE